MIAHEEIQALKTPRMWPKQRLTFWILLACAKASATANAGQPEKTKENVSYNLLGLHAHPKLKSML
jgi:hypothetical protein